jgi:thioester reductase-like protein
MTTALITGATGFLGQGAIGEILQRDPQTRLVALIRARDATELERRLQKLLAPLDEKLRTRVEAVRGDIARPRLGLDAKEYDALAQRIDRVVHIAATTRFDHSLEDARRINVGGTEQALALCRLAVRNNRSGRLDYVGTAFVAGDRGGTAYEHELDVGQRFRNTYEQSKLEAESQVRSAGVPAAILRPSIIVGDSRTGSTTSYKTIYWPMKVLFRFYGYSRPVLPRVVRLPVRPECLLDIVPVDWVAQSLGRIYSMPEAVGQSLHLASGPGAATIEELVNFCCDHFGVARLKYLDPQGKARHFGRLLRPLIRAAAPRFARNGELMMAYTVQNPAFDTAGARAHGIVAPPIQDYFRRLISFAYREDFGER